MLELQQKRSGTCEANDRLIIGRRTLRPHHSAVLRTRRHLRLTSWASSVRAWTTSSTTCSGAVLRTLRHPAFWTSSSTTCYEQSSVPDGGVRVSIINGVQQTCPCQTREARPGEERSHTATNAFGDSQASPEDPISATLLAQRDTKIENEVIASSTSRHEPMLMFVMTIGQ